jgi:hypothetical protein
MTEFTANDVRYPHTVNCCDPLPVVMPNKLILNSKVCF